MGRNLGFSESLGDAATEWKGPAVFSCSFASADSTYQLCELGRGSSLPWVLWLSRLTGLKPWAKPEGFIRSGQVV